MLIVLQGPKGSGKTTLAKYIKEISEDAVMFDNVDTTDPKAVKEIERACEHKDVIVTTTGVWPNQRDLVWNLQPIAPYNMLPEANLINAR